MPQFRDFSASEGFLPKARIIDDDAPLDFRNELVDLIFSLAAQCGGDEYFHRLVTQNIGASVAGNPYGGYRYAVGRDLGRVHWTRVYDLLPRLADEFRKGGLFSAFRENLNRILAANGIAWEMDARGKLVRVLPEEAGTAVRIAVQELSRVEFAAAQKLLVDAIDAYNAQPQRARDACANAFDALESAAKIVAKVPSGTFGDVLKEMRVAKSLSTDTLRMLEALGTIRHNHFGHGMTQPFSLTKSEVDFVYLSCIAAATLFARMS